MHIKEFLLLFLLLTVLITPVLAQSNYEMVVEGIDGKKTVFNTSDIQRVYFQTNEEIDDNAQSCNLLSFYLSDGEREYHSYSISDSVVQVIVDNNADLTRIKAHFTYNGTKVTINGVEQISGETVNDFSDFCNPLVYVVNGTDGGGQKVYN